MPLPAPAAGAGGAPQQAPFGTSGATTPTPNLGYEAAGLQKLGSVVKQLEDLIPLFGVTTEAGQAVMDTLKKLVKFVPPGSVTPAGEKNQIEQMMMKNVANNQQVQALRQSQMGGGAPGGPPGGGMAPPPAMPKVA